jgi:thiol:disulfide interchange protein
MRTVLFAIAFLFCGIIATSQDMAKFNLYKPTENATAEIAKAIKEAKASGKHVFIQIGGNWCIWCARFHDFVGTDKSLDSVMKSNFVVYHLNYGKENYNKDVMARYGFPQRFDFPVFLILNAEGELIHTQNSAYLEEGKGYSKEKVTEFFNHWSPKALKPEQYKEQ